MLTFLASAVFKRIVAAIVMVLLPLLNARLGLEIPSEQVVAAILGVAAFIVQSGLKAGAVVKADAQLEAAKLLAPPVPDPAATPSMRGPSPAP
jgi:hypothetical protein